MIKYFSFTKTSLEKPILHTILSNFHNLFVKVFPNALLNFRAVDGILGELLDILCLDVSDLLLAAVSRSSAPQNFMASGNHQNGPRH